MADLQYSIKKRFKKRLAGELTGQFLQLKVNTFADQNSNSADHFTNSLKICKQNIEI
jgi:hypothetical protein